MSDFQILLSCVLITSLLFYSMVTYSEGYSQAQSKEKLQDVVELFAFRCAFAAILADGSVVSCWVLVQELTGNLSYVSYHDRDL